MSLVTVRVSGGRGGLDLGFATDAKSLRDAINEAVVQQTDETKWKLRAHVAGRIRGARAAYTIYGTAGLDRRPGADVGSIVGVVSTRWFRPASPGSGRRWFSPLDVLETGAVVVPRHGKYLAIPTAAVIRRDRERLTPADFAEAGIELRFVPAGRLGPHAALVVDNFRRRAGKRGGYAVASARAIRQGRAETVVMFWLKRSNTVPDRLDVAPIKAEADARLAEKVIVGMAKRGIGD